MLGLGDHAPLAAPAVERAPGEVGEAAGRATLGQALGLGCGQIVGDGADQTLVAGEPEQVVDPVGFAPTHQRLAREARVGPQQDLDPRPTRPDPGDDPRHLLEGARRSVDVRAPESGRQQLAAAEHVQRQVAVAVIVAIEEPAFLVAVQRVVGGVEIEDDLARRCLVRGEEEIDEQALDGGAVMADLMVARGSDRRMLEPVERALAGERGAVLASGLELAGEGREHWVVAQLIVVDEILVAERDAEHPLRDHGLDGVLDLRRGATVGEARREPTHHMDHPIGRAEQERTGVRGDLAAVERGHHSAPLDHFKPEQVAATLCRHRGAPLQRVKALSQKNFPAFRAPMHLSSVRNPG